ncbi:MAG: DMT family transporter, partial [Firmicutes bacterium]|nr:DMT family transporter [Bacillota bacterium]
VKPALHTPVPPSGTPLAAHIQRPQTSRWLLALMISLMILIWAFNFLVAKVGLRHLPPLTLASFRVVLAGLIMLVLYLPQRARLPRPTSRDLWVFARLGLLGVALNQVLFTVGLRYTTVGHSSLIIGTGPITILLLARLMGLETLTVKKTLGVGLSFSGLAVLVSESGQIANQHLGGPGGTWLGDLITLAGSLAFAGFAVAGKRVASRYDSLSVNTFAHLTGAVLVLPLAIGQGLLLDWRAVRWPGWFALAYMAGLASVAAYLIWYWALRRMAASRLAVFGYLQPLLATTLGVLFLGEAVTAHLLLGGGLIVAGVILAELGPRDEPIRENIP